MDERDVIFDWNADEAKSAPRPVRLHDETMRDGIQSPSIHDPAREQKHQILRLLDQAGIHPTDVGLPGAGPRAYGDSQALVQQMVDEDLNIRATCAARTHPNDLRPIIEISQATGLPVEVMAFLGSSPIRMYAEAWDVDKMEELTRTSTRMCVDAGLPFSFVTEDTIRSHPETLRRLFEAALEEGASCLILCDTVGHATPQGVTKLVEWTLGLLRETGVEDSVRVDWHGHNDRGLSLINTMAAIDAGCDLSLIHI